MSRIDLTMTEDEYRLFECGQQLMLIAELAQEDPKQAVSMARDLSVPVAALELRAAVICHAELYAKEQA